MNHKLNRFYLKLRPGPGETRSIVVSMSVCLSANLCASLSVRPHAYLIANSHRPTRLNSTVEFSRVGRGVN